MYFKDRLKQLLDEKGVTKTQFSRDTGISVYRINTWLKGTREAGATHIILLSRYFQVSTDFICGLTKKR